MNILSASEKAGIHTLSLHIVRSIAEQHGGTLETDPATRAVGIVVPKERRDLCSEEICRQLEGMQTHLFVLLLTGVCGKMMVRMSEN